MEKPTVLVTASHRGGGQALAPVIDSMRRDGRVHVDTIASDLAVPVLANHQHRVLEQAYGFPSYDIARRVIDDVRPGLVLAGTAAVYEKHPEANVWDKQIVAAARNAGIPSMAVLDAWMNYGIVRFGNTETGEPWCFLPDKLAVMDAYALEGIVREGLPAGHQDRVVITGNPYHDVIAQKRTAFTLDDRAAIRADLNLREDVAVVFYGSSWIEPNYAEGTKHYLGFTDRSVLDELVPALAELKPVQLLINMHPAEQREYPMRYVPYLEQACNLGFDAVLFSPLPHKKTYHPHELMLASDIFCSPISSLLGEAAMLGKPAVSLQPGRIKGTQDFSAPFSELGVVLRVDKPEDMLPSIKGILGGSIKLKPFAVEGKGTENVTKLAYQMLGIQ